MNWIRLGSIVCATCAAAALAVWTMQPRVIDEHRQARRLILHFTFARMDDPVVVLGDSIVEASTLPRSICGHPVVNAGLNGAHTASDLGDWLADALGGKRAAMIVVALGTNDALIAESPQDFGARYGALLDQLSKLAPRLVALGIPPVEAALRTTVETRDAAMKAITAFNAMLPGLAARHESAFAAMPAMPTPHTIDGVHLDSDGYLVWDQAVLQAAAAICG